MSRSLIVNVGSWQITVLASLLAVGLKIFVFDVSMPWYYRKARLNIVNFFLFLFVSTSIIASLSFLSQTDSASYLLVGAALVSMYAMLFVVLWLTPSEERLDPANAAAVASSQMEERSHEKRGGPQPHEKLLLRAILSAILVLAPVLLLVYVHKNSEFYISSVRAYKVFVSQRVVQGSRSSTQPTGSTSVSATDADLPPTVAEYAQTIQLHFLSRTTIQCLEKDDVACTRLRNAIVGSQEDRVIFVSRILYYFLGLCLIFRYYGRIVQSRYKYRRKAPDGLELQSDVVRQCSNIVAVSGAFLLALVLGGVDFSSLGIFAGLIGAGLSVALRDVLENVVAGILLLWGRTIKKDDVITVPRSESTDTGSTYAIVQRMTMRYTIVEDRNEVRRLIPNSKLTNSTIENWTHEDRMVRLRVLVDVDYNTDLRLARTILESLCYEVSGIESKDRPPKAVVLGFGDCAIHFALRFWVSDPHKGIRPILSEVYIAILERFREEGIKIPYPRRDLHIIAPEDEAAGGERKGNGLLIAGR